MNDISQNNNDSTPASKFTKNVIIILLMVDETSDMLSLLKMSFFPEYNHNILHVLAERNGTHETIKKAIINGGNVSK